MTSAPSKRIYRLLRGNQQWWIKGCVHCRVVSTGDCRIRAQSGSQSGEVGSWREGVEALLLSVRLRPSWTLWFILFYFIFLGIFVILPFDNWFFSHSERVQWCLSCASSHGCGPGAGSHLTLMVIWLVVAVCLLVGRIKQKLLNGFPWHLNGGMGLQPREDAINIPNSSFVFPFL